MENPQDPSSKKKQLDDYIKYSGIGLQMVAIIIIGVFAGVKLDKVLELSVPVFTLVLSLGSVAFTMYYLIKKLSGKNPK